jgi:hypothetical protein
MCAAALPGVSTMLTQNRSAQPYVFKTGSTKRGAPSIGLVVQLLVSFQTCINKMKALVILMIEISYAAMYMNTMHAS